ncbi:hypothetical protein LSUE1_G000217 [Lachnellula suecica]|uniref:Uncharacterized protein n=1 Tax=Lachnellula suecica TaxID=602035 RepID=A0A8T9CIS2_9HELO|nr:hypothetical protein LSUE1_G000217 [Lachnellula suecica]
MFLVSSGAAMHGHEYSANRDSPPYESNTIPRRYPLRRSAFSTPISRRSSTHDPYVPKPAARRLQRPLSEIIPKSHEPTVRFQEPDADTMSEDGRSVVNSEGSGTTAGGRSRHRPSLKSSTVFCLAHPAPTMTGTQRLLQIRPKLLLQLQEISANARPKPVLDLVPSTVVVPRLVKKFPRMLKAKGELGANDVIVFRSEDYEAPDDHFPQENDSDEEGFGSRDLVAVICQLRKEMGGSEGRAEIVLNDCRWLASPMPKNLFEFVSVDERGIETKARWVKRKSARESVDLSNIADPNEDVKLTFSVLDPNSRRHPVMATLSRNKLDIQDSYATSSSAGKYPPLAPTIRNPSGENEQPVIDEPSPERITHVIDENLKTLIQVTAIWVALRQGWSPYFRYNDAPGRSSSMNAGPSNGGRVRSMSLTPDSARPVGPATGASTPESATGGFSTRINKIYHRGSPANMASSPVEGIGAPQRSVSAGTAFMKRATARKAVSVVASDSEGESNFGPPKRAATEGPSISGAQISTPPPALVLPGSAATTPETPTKQQRRTQSAYVPTSALQNAYPNGVDSRRSTDGTEGKTILPGTDNAVKSKSGRWKAFCGFFRRNNTSSSN